MLEGEVCRNSPRGDLPLAIMYTCEVTQPRQGATTRLYVRKFDAVLAPEPPSGWRSIVGLSLYLQALPMVQFDTFTTDTSVLGDIQDVAGAPVILD